MAGSAKLESTQIGKVHRTRSGRISMPPLASWLGERIIPSLHDGPPMYVAPSPVEREKSMYLWTADVLERHEKISAAVEQKPLANVSLRNQDVKRKSKYTRRSNQPNLQQSEDSSAGTQNEGSQEECSEQTLTPRQLSQRKGKNLTLNKTETTAEQYDQSAQSGTAPRKPGRKRALNNKKRSPVVVLQDVLKTKSFAHNIVQPQSGSEDIHIDQRNKNSLSDNVEINRNIDGRNIKTTTGKKVKLTKKINDSLSFFSDSKDDYRPPSKMVLENPNSADSISVWKLGRKTSGSPLRYTVESDLEVDGHASPALTGVTNLHHKLKNASHSMFSRKSTFVTLGNMNVQSGLPDQTNQDTVHDDSAIKEKVLEKERHFSCKKHDSINRRGIQSSKSNQKMSNNKEESSESSSSSESSHSKGSETLDGLAGSETAGPVNIPKKSSARKRYFFKGASEPFGDHQNNPVEVKGETPSCDSTKKRDSKNRTSRSTNRVRAKCQSGNTSEKPGFAGYDFLATKSPVVTVSEQKRASSSSIGTVTKNVATVAKVLDFATEGEEIDDDAITEFESSENTKETTAVHSGSTEIRKNQQDEVDSGSLCRTDCQLQNYRNDAARLCGRTEEEHVDSSKAMENLGVDAGEFCAEADYQSCYTSQKRIKSKTNGQYQNLSKNFRDNMNSTFFIKQNGGETSDEPASSEDDDVDVTLHRNRRVRPIPGHRLHQNKASTSSNEKRGKNSRVTSSESDSEDQGSHSERFHVSYSQMQNEHFKQHSKQTSFLISPAERGSSSKAWVNAKQTFHPNPRDRARKAVGIDKKQTEQIDLAGNSTANNVHSSVNSKHLYENREASSTSSEEGDENYMQDENINKLPEKKIVQGNGSRQSNFSSSLKKECVQPSSSGGNNNNSNTSPAVVKRGPGRPRKPQGKSIHPSSKSTTLTLADSKKHIENISVPPYHLKESLQSVSQDSENSDGQVCQQESGKRTSHSNKHSYSRVSNSTAQNKRTERTPIDSATEKCGLPASENDDLINFIPDICQENSSGLQSLGADDTSTSNFHHAVKKMRLRISSSNQFDGSDNDDGNKVDGDRSCRQMIRRKHCNSLNGNTQTDLFFGQRVLDTNNQGAAKSSRCMIWDLPSLREKFRKLPTPNPYNQIRNRSDIFSPVNGPLSQSNLSVKVRSHVQPLDRDKLRLSEPHPPIEIFYHVRPMKNANSRKSLPYNASLLPQNNSKPSLSDPVELSGDEEEFDKPHHSPLSTSKRGESSSPKEISVATCEKENYAKGKVYRTTDIGSIFDATGSKNPGKGTMKRKKWIASKIQECNRGYDDDICAGGRAQAVADEVGKLEDLLVKKTGKLNMHFSTPKPSELHLKDFQPWETPVVCVTPTDFSCNRRSADEYIYRRNAWKKEKKRCKNLMPQEITPVRESEMQQAVRNVDEMLKKVNQDYSESEISSEELNDYYFSDFEDDKDSPVVFRNY